MNLATSVVIKETSCYWNNTFTVTRFRFVEDRNISGIICCFYDGRCFHTRITSYSVLHEYLVTFDCVACDPTYAKQLLTKFVDERNEALFDKNFMAVNIHLEVSDSLIENALLRQSENRLRICDRYWLQRVCFYNHCLD